MLSRADAPRASTSGLTGRCSGEHGRAFSGRVTARARRDRDALANARSSRCAVSSLAPSTSSSGGRLAGMQQPPSRHPRPHALIMHLTTGHDHHTPRGAWPFTCSGMNSVWLASSGRLWIGCSRRTLSSDWRLARRRRPLFISATEKHSEQKSKTASRRLILNQILMIRVKSRRNRMKLPMNHRMIT